MIPPVNHIVADWNISISDRGALNKPNPNKLDYNSQSRVCLINGCNNVIRINRTSGLCDAHLEHEHDLLLSLTDPNGLVQAVPAHKDIIDSLMLWARPRNYNLSSFFENISFSILGNIPDVTSLANKVTHTGIVVRSLNEGFQSSIEVAEMCFPVQNNSSYQPLAIRGGSIPVIVLAHIFIGLVVCEEANRGDRWHCRVVRGNESITTQLGGAMPIAYFAARSFGWGIEMDKSARLLTR